jgi:RimJ/RimL family protein N-acetyltransferase
MFLEIGQSEAGELVPLLDGVPQDPVLYMVLEGNRAGRIFVDRPSTPGVALLWTGMEYAYLMGDATGCRADVVDVVEGTILPALETAGLGFVTVFPFGVSPATVQAWFPYRLPVSFGVNAFTFEPERFARLRREARALPPGYELGRLDRETLEQAAYQRIQEDVLFCWDSLERFEALGLGTCLASPQGEVVSACYAIATGAEAFHITIWTHPDHRRRGLARHAAMAFLDDSLPQGRSIYWINDAPNVASRRLAESVGFVYAGDLATVDIPVEPHRFHLSLAEHFARTLGLYRQAGELYDRAFVLQAGTPEAYQRAAEAWHHAGDEAKAEKYRLKAASAR